MSRRRVVIIGAATLLAVLVGHAGGWGCNAEPVASPALAETVGAGKRAPLLGPAGDEERRWVEETLARLTLEQRVGQMFMGYVFGTSADDREPAMVAANQQVSGVATAAEAVRRYGLGGVIYFNGGGKTPEAIPDNIVDPDQLRRMSADLQKASGIPLLIATDQEQGPVTRIRDGVTLLPGQLAQGAGGEPAGARDAAQVTGADLLGLGINVNFAPVADVNTNPANPVIAERAFSDDPETVSRFTAAAVEGYAAAGVAATAKHFPGHGSTVVDSHFELPEVTHSREQLDTVDLPPFRAAIAAGVPLVMVGHLLVGALDPDEPTSLSQPVVEGLLRRELGFRGVVVTDALNMAAVAGRHRPADAAVRAVLAGNDLLLMPPRLAEARDAVLDAVRDGRIPPERIDESVRRLLQLKWRLGRAVGQRPADPAAVATRIAGNSVTLLDMACPTLPLRAGTTAEVVGPAAAAERLRAALAERGVTPPDGPAESAASTATVRIELTGNEKPVRATSNTVVVSIAAPYSPPVGAGAWLATYSSNPASMASLAAVLTGAAEAKGRLPVSTTMPDGRPLARGSGRTGSISC